MNEIRNQFSLSRSRDEIFQTCPRQYYFTCYGYWGGWERDAARRTRQIHILKRMRGRKVLGAQRRPKEAVPSPLRFGRKRKGWA